MKKFFINNPLFIILCPLFSGFIIYLIILLYHNEVRSIANLYADGELLICILLAFLIQEITRRSFNYIHKNNSLTIKPKSINLHAFFSLGIGGIVIWAVVVFFYRRVLGFAPGFYDLLLFFVLYGILSFFFTALLMSYGYLSIKNTTAIKKEKDIKREISREFHQFKKGINPELLFESLESLLIMIENENPDSEELLDSMAIIYRYILAKRSLELIDINDEIKIADELIHLFSFLPSAQITMRIESEMNSLVIPGTLLKIIELITKKSITSKKSNAVINVSQEEGYCMISFKSMEKLNAHIELEDLLEISKSYEFFTNQKIKLSKNQDYTRIALPVLNQIETETTLYESIDYRR